MTPAVASVVFEVDSAGTATAQQRGGSGAGAEGRLHHALDNSWNKFYDRGAGVKEEHLLAPDSWLQTSIGR
jgi:hypothetical protein